MYLRAALIAAGDLHAISIEELRNASCGPDDFVWVDLVAPSNEEFSSVAAAVGLDAFMADDAVRPRHRAALDGDGPVVFVALPTPQPGTAGAGYRFSELRLFATARAVVTVRYDATGADDQLWQRTQAEREVLRFGPQALLALLIDVVVASYDPLVARLEHELDTVEAAVFADERAVYRQIYQLMRSVVGFQRAIGPLADGLEALLRTELGKDEGDVRVMLRQLRDRVLHVAEQLSTLRDMLQAMLSVHLTLVSSGQTDRRQEVAQQISAWAAILAVPSIISGIYGMNFTHMPELEWPLGYPFALGLMVAICTLLYRGFKRSGWL